jgi:DNA-binding transcriptional regulator YdaS (Cro superfamily)
MNLKDWLDRNERTCADFSEEIGVSRAAVSRWVRGNRTPHPRLALLIERHTGGHVPVTIWEETDHLSKGAADLIRWMRSQGVTASATASAIGVHHTSVHQWLRASVVPSPASLEALNKHTGLGLRAWDFT